MLGNQLRYPLHTLAQHIIGNLKGLEQWRPAVDRVEQAVIRDSNERINLPPQLLDRPLGIDTPLLTFKGKRLGGHAHTENTEITRYFCYHVASPRACATTSTNRHEDHICPLKRLTDLVERLTCRGLTYTGVSTSTKTIGGVMPKMNLNISLRIMQRLRIGVHCNELHTSQASVLHSIDSRPTSATDANDFDTSKGLDLAWFYFRHSRFSPCATINFTITI